MQADTPLTTEALQEKLAHEERKINLEKNLAKLEVVEKDFRRYLKEETSDIKQLADDPSKLTPEQIKRLTGEGLTEEEKAAKELEEKKAREGWKLTYEIKNDIEKSNEYLKKEIKANETKIENAADERTKTIHQDKNIELHKEVEKNNKIYDEKVKPSLNERDQQREDLKKAVEKSPKFSKDKVKNHFIEHAEEYKEALAKDPNHPALKELHEMVRKVGLAEELGVEPKLTINQQIEKATTDYPPGEAPRKVTDKIATSMVHNLGYSEHAKIIEEKTQVKEITQEKVSKVGAPVATPHVPGLKDKDTIKR